MNRKRHAGKGGGWACKGVVRGEVDEEDEAVAGECLVVVGEDVNRFKGRHWEEVPRRVHEQFPVLEALSNQVSNQAKIQ